MVKDHSDSERGNPVLSLHGLLFPINSKVSFYMHHPTDHGLCYISRGALAGTRNRSIGQSPSLSDKNKGME